MIFLIYKSSSKKINTAELFELKPITQSKTAVACRHRRQTLGTK